MFNGVEITNGNMVVTRLRTKKRKGKTVKTHTALIEKSNEKTVGKEFKANRWGLRHVQAMRTPIGCELPIVKLIHGAALYADNHRARFESSVGDDYVLGPYWQAIVEATKGLLNGELGRLDAGTCSELLGDMLVLESVGDRM